MGIAPMAAAKWEEGGAYVFRAMYDVLILPLPGQPSYGCSCDGGVWDFEEATKTGGTQCTCRKTIFFYDGGWILTLGSAVNRLYADCG